MQKEYAEKLIQKTQQDYQKLAKEFSVTRAFPWQELEDLIKYIKPGQKVLDAGCGNGRSYQLLRSKKINYLGVDNSPALIREAQNKYQFGNFRVMDLTNLECEKDTFDTIFCIAALQHIPSKKLRFQVLQDFHQILKPNGYLIMTNWNLWQKKYFWQTLKYSLSSLCGKHRELDLKDVYMPWKARFGVVDRYYHAFIARELNKLLQDSGFKIKKSYYVKKGEKSDWRNGYNLCTIAKKVKNLQ